MEALKREEQAWEELWDGYLMLYETYNESSLLHLLLFELISIYYSADF